MPQSATKNLVLDSDFEEIQKLEPFLEEIKAWAGISEKDYSRVMLVLSEAVTNAILHGNKQESGKNVEITATVSDQTLSLTIQDEGEGFDPENLPNPLKEENLLNESGRGVYLIKQYADEVTFEDNGTSITAHFELENSDEDH